MSEMYDNLDDATAALANTAQKAASLIRSESARAKQEALNTRREIDDMRKQMKAAKEEFETMRVAVQKHNNDRDRVTRSASWAWSSVGAMATILIFAVAWTCIQLTRGHDVANTLTQRVALLQDSLNQQQSLVAQLQAQLDASRLAEADAKAQLADVLNAYVPEEIPVAQGDLFVPAGPQPLWASIAQTQEEPEISSAE